MLLYNLNCPRLNHNCTKCYGLTESGEIDRSTYMTPCCQHSPCGVPTFVSLRYAYTDDWGRPTFTAANGMRFKDTNCGRGEKNLHYVTSAGEPDCPIHFTYVIEEDAPTNN